MIQGFGLFIFFAQSIPRIRDFIEYGGSDYTPSELLRMELAILDQLRWDLCVGTPLDFLNIVKYKEFAESAPGAFVPLEQLITKDGQAHACTRPCTCTTKRWPTGLVTHGEQ